MEAAVPNTTTTTTTTTITADGAAGGSAIGAAETPPQMQEMHKNWSLTMLIKWIQKKELLIDLLHSMNDFTSSLSGQLENVPASELKLLRSQYAWVVLELQNTNFKLDACLRTSRLLRHALMLAAEPNCSAADRQREHLESARQMLKRLGEKKGVRMAANVQELCTNAVSLLFLLQDCANGVGPAPEHFSEALERLRPRAKENAHTFDNLCECATQLRDASEHH